MINRYEIPAVSRIWEESAKWKQFLEVELAVLATLEDEKKIPSGTAARFRGVRIDPKRIAEIEATTRHDVVAFCNSITEQVAPQHSRFFHYGVTSSDIIDTALTLQIRDSLDLVIPALEKLRDCLCEKITETSDLLALGRSHGMVAEPLLFSQKLLSFWCELSRRLREYREFRQNELTGQLSGAVGNYTLLSPTVESKALSRLGLRAEPVSTQVIPRDRIAKLVGIGARTGAAIERLAVELRHLHRSEVGEISEGFGKGQTGSSTMPHKKNPVASENVTGISRVLRSHESIALENTVLWHERDISHSSAERLYLPDHFGLLVYALERMGRTLRNLEIHRETIEGRVRADHRVFSSLLLHKLLDQNDCPRETLYPIVQKAAFQSQSLGEMLSIIARECGALGLKADLGNIDFDSIKYHYERQFQEVLKRSMAEYA
jgi:adenylosuccinate lyase